MGAADFKIHPEGFPSDYFKCLTKPRQPSVDSSVSVTIKALLSRSSATASSSSPATLEASSSLQPSFTSAEEHKELVEDTDRSDDFFDCDIDSDDSDIEDNSENDTRVVRVVVNGKIRVYKN